MDRILGFSSRYPVQFLGRELRSLFRTAHCSPSEINNSQPQFEKAMHLPKRPETRKNEG